MELCVGVINLTVIVEEALKGIEGMGTARGPIIGIDEFGR
jgi:hypothetical protein